MSVIRGVGAAAAAVAMLGMAVPAQAQYHGDHHGGYHGGHHDHDDGIDGGDVLLGAILAGGLIALVSAASKSSRADAAPPPPPPADDRDAYDAAPPPPAGGQGYAGAEDGAVDECAAAAEDKGRQSARVAQVKDILGVDPAQGGGYYVRGTIELGDGYRSDARTVHGFRCSALPGRAASVVIDN